MNFYRILENSDIGTKDLSRLELMTKDKVRQTLAIICCGMIIAGLVVSRIGISVGMIGLVGIAVFRKDLGQKFRDFFRQTPLVVVTVIFLIYLVSGLWSEDLTYWLDRVRIKLPFLLLPFAISTLRPFTKKEFHGLLAFFLVIIAGGVTFSLINYLLHFDSFNATYLKGQVLTTPVDHIRFSLMVVFAVASGIYLLFQKFYFKYPWEKWGIAALTGICFLFLHVLAVRSGLLALYVVLLFLLGWYVFTYKKYLTGSWILALLIALPLGAFQLFPTLKNKARYMDYDLVMMSRNKKWEHLSDGGRVASMINGITVGSKSPIVGVGVGDLITEMDEAYTTNFPKMTKRLIPHNQYIFVFATTGILGLLLFLWGTFYSLFIRPFRRHMLFVSLHLIIFTSFLIESTIEGQLGTAFYALFLILGLHQIPNSTTTPRTDTA